MLRLVVMQKEEGMTLLNFLKVHKDPAISVKHLKKQIDAKCCLVNGAIERFATRVLKKGDQVELKALVEEQVEILYEDEDLTIVNKPSGWVSEAIPKIMKPLILVHRLDKETSGALILAKNKKTYEKMVVLFEKKVVKKSYLALVKGKPLQEEGVIDRPIGLKKKLKNQNLYHVTSQGKDAKTLWRCLKSQNGISLLLCSPITGRTHQIRVHLQSIGFPILGDDLYGKIEAYPRLLLHAYQLTFPHPIHGKEVKVTVPLPKIFKELFPLCASCRGLS